MTSWFFFFPFLLFSFFLSFSFFFSWEETSLQRSRADNLCPQDILTLASLLILLLLNFWRKNLTFFSFLPFLSFFFTSLLFLFFFFSWSTLAAHGRRLWIKVFSSYFWQDSLALVPWTPPCRFSVFEVAFFRIASNPLHSTFPCPCSSPARPLSKPKSLSPAEKGD